VCRARELLAAVVASEEALIDHQSTCRLCRVGQHDICLTHTDLVISSAGAMVEAKLYLDVTEPDCTLSSYDMAVG